MNAWNEDDSIQKRSIRQKETMSAQLVDILGSRLDALRELAKHRQHALECDLEVTSSHCSTKVPALIHATGEKHQPSLNRSKKQSTVATSASQALLDRLFGADDTRLTSLSQMYKTRNEMRQQETKKNRRMELERQLQASMEGFVTRSVDSVAYEHGTSIAVDIKPKLLLAYTFERIRLTQNRKSFRAAFISQLSCEQFHSIFWLIFCSFFQEGKLEQRVLVEAISSQYVKMLAAIRFNKDFFYRSRHLYTNSFRNKVFLIICELLYGLKLSPTSVQATRKIYFPDEYGDENYRVDNGHQHSSDASIRRSSSQPAGLMLIAAEKKKAPDKTLQPSPSESVLQTKFDVRDGTPMDEILDLATSELPTEEQFDHRSHQVRKRFNATQLSPLVQQYMSTDRTRRPIYLQRTTPIEQCAVGGSNTFHRVLGKVPQLEHKELDRATAKYWRQNQKSQHRLRQDLRKIDRNYDAVLRRGPNHVNRFCSDLVSQRAGVLRDPDGSSPT